MEVNIVLPSDLCKTRKKKEFTEKQQTQYSNHHHKIPILFLTSLVYFTNILAQELER